LNGNNVVRVGCFGVAFTEIIRALVSFRRKIGDQSARRAIGRRSYLWWMDGYV
jgi:hypothetical protein